MSDPSVFRGGDGPFERLVYALAIDEGNVLEAVTSELAIFRSKKGVRVAVARWRPEEGEALKKTLEQLIHDGASRSIFEVVVVGGGPEVKKVMKSATPFFTTNKVLHYHLPESGAPWRSATARSTAVWPHLVAVAGGTAPAPDWKRFDESLSAQQQQMAAEVEEVAVFQSLVGARTPIVTYVLLGVIAAVFALELVLGGADSTPVLVRLGGLVPERVREGDWWRLFSCTFLHAGGLHAVLNGYVLLALGTSLERVLGARRFLVLYWFSALAGSLTSVAFLGEKFSVGASGALWGLLGAEAVLAFRSQGLLPAPLVASMRQAAISNLVLNVVNSFRPEVDMAAHFGGGAMGALLVGSGILTAGLPRLADVRPEETAPEDKAPFWLAPVSALMSIVAAASLGMAIWSGKAWALGSPPVLERQSVPELGLSIAVPQGFDRRPIEPAGPGEQIEVSFGDLRGDPAIVAFVRIPFDRVIPEEQMDSELAGLEEQLGKESTAKDQPALISPPKRVEVGPETGLISRLRFPNGVLLDRAVLLRPSELLKVELILWPEFREAYQDVATRVLDSVETTSTSTPAPAP